MHDAQYYRGRAAHARHLAGLAHQRHLSDDLRKMAQDYDDIAEDLETGAVEIRHPELLPQRHARK